MSYPYDIYKPFGASVTSPVLDQAQTRLHQTEQTYSRTQQELQSLVEIRRSTPMSAVDTRIKDQEIAALQLQLKQTEAEMNTLKETIQRQQRTIKTQSVAISNPKQHYVTPHRPGNHPQFGTFQGQAPSQSAQPPPPYYGSGASKSFQQPTQPLLPAFTQPFEQQPLTGNNPSPFGDTRGQQWRHPMTQHQPSQMQPLPPPASVNTFGSPEPLRPFNGWIGYHSGPQSSNDSHGTPTSGNRNNRGIPANAQPFPQPSFDNNNSMALVKASDVSNSDPVKAQLQKVIYMSEQFSHAHVNHPSTAKDEAMPQEIKQRLLKAASNTTAFQFMQTPFTRYFLVTKIIFQWLLKNVLKHDSFCGFDKTVDHAIEAQRAQIYQCKL